MASNSDSIYYVLTHMKSHPEMVQTEPLKYGNVLTLSISDSFKVADQDIYFPDQQLMVNRLTEGFVAKNGDLLDYFYEMTKREIPNFHDVWITTSHLMDRKAFLIELSFE
ncbi:hypothetical protein ABTQ33_09210 [Paucilactobacillus suebicus]|nr:hypothetical protein [Paucilactobacillus suebicus]